MRLSRALLVVVPALAAIAAARTPRRLALAGRVVVLTGASTGLGRATALALAARGCRLVLAARRAALLEEVAAECRAAGGDALVVPTDVTHEDEIRALCARALEQWGRIDIWINNAAVTLYARVEEAEFRQHQRVLETNLFGPYYAARAVVPVFRRQQAGIMINVGSVLAKVGHALVPPYVISKFAMHGLSDALRVELADEPDIHICTILPYAIDTPHFESAGNVIGRQPHPLPPVQSPEKVAVAIVELAERPRRQLHVPRAAAIGLMMHAVWPQTTERLLHRALLRFHLGGPQAPTEGGLFQPPATPGTIHGHRPPLVSTAGFMLWLVRELAAILIGRSADRRVQQGRRVGERLDALDASANGGPARFRSL